MSTGNLNKAAQALARVRGQPIDSQYIQDELAEIIANFEYEKQVMPQTSYLGGWANCFKGDIRKGSSNIRRTLVGIAMQMMQQLTGINFIFYFGKRYNYLIALATNYMSGVVFFQQLGTISNPFLLSVITTLVNVCSTPVSFYIIERFGRRAILIYGAMGMIVCEFITGIVGDVAGKPEDHNNAAVSAMIAFICIYIFCFATTWGPAAWVVVGELFPIPIRSRGVGLSTSSNWLWNCIIAVITPYLVGSDPGDANLKSNIFFMWGGLCCVSLAFAYFFVPETKGLTLEQIDRMLEETTPRKSAGWVPHSTFAADMHLEEKAIEVPVIAETVRSKSTSEA